MVGLFYETVVARVGCMHAGSGSLLAKSGPLLAKSGSLLAELESLACKVGFADVEML